MIERVEKVCPALKEPRAKIQFQRGHGRAQAGCEPITGKERVDLRARQTRRDGFPGQIDLRRIAADRVEIPARQQKIPALRKAGLKRVEHDRNAVVTNTT